MAEETTTGGEPQAGSTPHAPQPQVGNTTTPEPQAGEGQSISLDEARKLRSEAANLRKRLKTYEDAEQAARDAQLGETERTQKQLADLQATYTTETKQLKERLVQYEVAKQAAKLKAIDPDDVAKLLNWSELEYDEDGTPNNAAKLLEKLVKNKPYLVAQPTQEPPVTPAQTAQTPTHNTPAIPAMNPGRTNIPAPGSQPPGTPFRRPSLSDPGVFVPPGTRSPWQP